VSLYPPWMLKYLRPLHAAVVKLQGADRDTLRNAATVMRRSVRAVASAVEKATDRLSELAKANAKGDGATLEDFGVYGHEDFMAAGMELMVDAERMMVQGTLEEFIQRNNLHRSRGSLRENLEIFLDMREHRR
jgi:hypothetical protein